jgi:surface carbohydrate biosynthesis protein
MNIYLHVEVSVRELDSKLLLAVLAASKGHEVLVTDGIGVIDAFKSGNLYPGIFHTKSITPSNIKIKRHQEIISKGFKITCLDEESTSFHFDGVEQNIKSRSSDKTVEQSEALFAWGEEEEKILKRLYTNNQHKIYKTGSPRVDLWKSKFLDYWKKPKYILNEPFLLVSSNMTATGKMQFHDNIKMLRDFGYFKRKPELFKQRFYEVSEDYKKIYEFILAIEYLAKNNNGYQIVFRPHPSENINSWKIFLKDIPNLYIIREDSISAWVNHAFAVMHNGCTTGLESIISGKPLLTFIPFEMEHDNKFLNSIGFKLNSKEVLLKKANEIFSAHKKDNIKREEIKLPEHINKKLYIDDNELAAEKILRIWENLNEKNLSQPNNWLKFYFLFKMMSLKNFFRKIVSKLFPKILKPIEKNHKFPSLNQNDIQARVNCLQNLLGIEKKLKCRLFSERTILIKNS